MMSRLFKVILLLFMVAPVIVVLYDVLARKAGYQVDDYDLKMMDRIPKLETKGETKFIIQSPTNTKEIFVYINGYRNLISFDKDMNINGSAIDRGREKSSRMATEEEKSKYEKEIKEEINKLLDDVYKAGEK